MDRKELPKVCVTGGRPKLKYKSAVTFLCMGLLRGSHRTEAKSLFYKIFYIYILLGQQINRLKWIKDNLICSCQ